MPINHPRGSWDYDIILRIYVGVETGIGYDYEAEKIGIKLHEYRPERTRLGELLVTLRYWLTTPKGWREKRAQANAKIEEVEP